jgi:hypothetical protein
MKPPVRRVVVLGLAKIAHLKICHASVGSVVGYRPQDCVSGSAIRTIDEGITVAPILRIEKFSDAVRAGGGIWSDKNGGVSTGKAVADREIVVAGEFLPFALERSDLRKRWLVFLKLSDKGVEDLSLTFDLDDNAIARVRHPAGQAQFVSETVDEGAETDPLNDTFDRYADPLNQLSPLK